MTKEHSVPEVVRIKRRISDDPIQALVLENNRKKYKKSRVVFKLARTDININVNAANESVLTKEGGDRTFLLSPTVDEFDELPEQLAELVKEYLTIEKEEAKKEELKKEELRKEELIKEEANKDESKERDTTDAYNANDANSGYVYDVYYKKIMEDQEFEKELGSIGIIKLAKEDLDALTDNADSDQFKFSDDEDSNAEDFYQNDYPEDEDDDKGIVIGNEEEWYSEEEDYYKITENEERREQREKLIEELGFDGAIEKIGLSEEEINHHYEVFFGEEQENEEDDEAEAFDEYED